MFNEFIQFYIFRKSLKKLGIPIPKLKKPKVIILKSVPSV